MYDNIKFMQQTEISFVLAMNDEFGGIYPLTSTLTTIDATTLSYVMSTDGQHIDMDTNVLSTLSKRVDRRVKSMQMYTIANENWPIEIVWPYDNTNACSIYIS
jgi:hypothetical protein